MVCIRRIDFICYYRWLAIVPKNSKQKKFIVSVNENKLNGKTSNALKFTNCCLVVAYDQIDCVQDLHWNDE